MSTFQADLAQVTTKDLLHELFSRYDEALFIGGCPSNTACPLQMATHFPQKTTRMPAVLIPALEKLLVNLRTKYGTTCPPVTPAVVEDAPTGAMTRPRPAARLRPVLLAEQS